MSSDIREVTTQELDNMVSGQRKFFLELIEKGQAKIVPDTGSALRKVTKDRQTPDRERPSAFTTLIGHEIKVVLVDGNTITGKLVTVWQFEITLKTAFNEIAILKHGILTAEIVS